MGGPGCHGAVFQVVQAHVVVFAGENDVVGVGSGCYGCLPFNH